MRDRISTDIMKSQDQDQGEPQTGQKAEDILDPEAWNKCELGGRSRILRIKERRRQ